MVLYAQTGGEQSDKLRLLGTDSGPEFHDTRRRWRCRAGILNLPNPSATGNNNRGGVFGISVNGTVSPMVASFTYNEQVPPSTGRIPTTLVVSVPLAGKPQALAAMWQGVRGSTVIIDSPDAERDPPLGKGRLAYSPRGYPAAATLGWGGATLTASLP